jgi:DNA mismatch repair protein MutS2
LIREVSEVSVSRPAEELLEFDKLKDIVARYTTCAPGRRFTEALAFRQDAAVLDTEFALIREAIAYLRDGSELGFGSLADPETWLPRVAIPASVLSTADLLDVASLMETVFSVRQAFKSETAKFPRLAERAAALPDFRHIATAIRHAILPSGEISDDASPQLKRIRAAMAQARAKIQHSLESILRTRGEPGGEDYITLRNDRFVIPVRASDRRAVPGVVHAASATGQTVFVEPLEAIDLNNRLVQLSDEEAGEIARILVELTDRVRADRGPLEAATASIAHFDSIFARARFAREFDCAIPEFSAGNSLRLDAARNPVLEATLRPQGRKAVPLSLALGGAETVMVVSGPNTGGKTVSLKSVGLAALSAQSAIPVAADRAEMPIFDRVLADIGDEQSIAADLSTFSAHMLNLKSMLDVATDRSLILVDEMGTGTAPGGRRRARRRAPRRISRPPRPHSRHHPSRSFKGLRFHHAWHRQRGHGIRRNKFAPHLPVARRRSRNFQRDRNRAASWPARTRGGARPGFALARIAGGARPDRLPPSQPR